MKKLSKGKKALLIIGIVIGSLAAIYGILALTNLFINISHKKYIEKVCTKLEYTSQLEPLEDEKGHVYFKLDDEHEEFKILNLTDIHFGGGFLSVNNDRETIDNIYYMLKTEKPDLVILNGDNVFAIPYISGTFNNKLASETVIKIFETAGVYYTTVFGNHDTEVFDYTNRIVLGNLYESGAYSCFKSESKTEGSNGLTSVFNQILYVLNKDNTVNEALILVDTNAYKDNSIKSVIDWTYDTIRTEDIEYLRDELTWVEENKNSGNKVQTMFFSHMPIAEYEIAYENYLKDETLLVGGVWGETIEEDFGVDGNDVRIWYGRCYDNKDIKSIDNLYETFKDEMIVYFCGHDHCNNSTVKYRESTTDNYALLSYNYSLDNLAYSDIENFGLQRGCTVITLKSDKTVVEHKNLYVDMKKTSDSIDINKFYYDDEITPKYSQAEDTYYIFEIDKSGNINISLD